MARLGSVLPLFLFLSGCATGPEPFRAWLAPFCLFNCVVSVIYAPGVEALDVELERKRRSSEN